MAARSGAGVVLAVSPLGFPWETRDPFLFCVHHDDHYPPGNAALGPAADLAGRDLGQDFTVRDGWRMYHGEVVPGFPRHPHRGFETVTVVRRGFVDHSDSLGAAARYGRGDVQWLTAGRGIQHAEMFPLLDRDGPNHLELFQIWLNLPAARKLVDPYFSMFWRDTLPRLTLADAQGRVARLQVVAGGLGGARPPAPPPDSWAADAAHDVVIATLTLEAGARFELPPAAPEAHRSLYLFRGAGLEVAGQAVPGGHRVDLAPGTAVALAAAGGAVELLLLQGRPIGEPVARGGPFVMNRREEIAQAYRDYQATGFGGWPWPAADPVHGRDAGRFARHADGRDDRPE